MVQDVNMQVLIFLQDGTVTYKIHNSVISAHLKKEKSYLCVVLFCSCIPPTERAPDRGKNTQQFHKCKIRLLRHLNSLVIWQPPANIKQFYHLLLHIDFDNGKKL